MAGTVRSPRGSGLHLLTRPQHWCVPALLPPLVDVNLRPYFQARFRLRPASPGVARTAVPVDYPALARDPVFEGLLATRQETMSATIPSYEHAIAQGERLAALLDRRIRRLR